LRAKPAVIVLGNGPIYVSKATLAALATRAHWLTAEWLPKYASELNDIELVWHDLKAFKLTHKTFTDEDTLGATIHRAVAKLNAERNHRPLGNQRISA
jgi:transposase